MAPVVSAGRRHPEHSFFIMFVRLVAVTVTVLLVAGHVAPVDAGIDFSPCDESPLTIYVGLDEACSTVLPGDFRPQCKDGLDCEGNLCLPDKALGDACTFGDGCQGDSSCIFNTLCSFQRRGGEPCTIGRFGLGGRAPGLARDRCRV